METYALAGIDYALWDNVVKRLFRPGMTLAQATLCGAYLFTLAKDSSIYVRGDTTIAVINENGIFLESGEYVNVMEDRLRVYEEHVNHIFMQCADTSISPARLEEELSAFANNAVALHKDHVEGVMRLVVKSGKAGRDFIYNRHPVFFAMAPKEQVLDDMYKNKLREAIAEQFGLSEDAMRLIDFESLTPPKDPSSEESQ